MKRLLLAVWMGVAVSSLAMGQDWARAKLANSPRHQEWVTVKHGTRSVQCFVVYPEVKDKAPAILMIHEIFGLSDWARSAADELAAAGYVVIAPDLVSGLGPKGGGTADFSDVGDVIKVVSSLPPIQVTDDLDAATEYIRKQPACNGHVAVVGFCWGGGQSFRYATHRPDLRAAFVFYGPPPATETISLIQCPVYGFYAGNDARISTTVPQTTKDMKTAGKTYQPVIYDGAGHGFMRAGEAPDASPANKAAHDQAWARLRTLLKGI